MIIQDNIYFFSIVKIGKLTIWTNLTGIYEKIFILTEFEFKNTIDVQLYLTLEPFEAVIFIIKALKGTCLT